jgi:aconitase (EC 4.2.1.3)
MAKGTVAYKILESHLVSGKLIPSEEIAIKIDQTLTQMPPELWHTCSLRQWVWIG